MKLEALGIVSFISFMSFLLLLLQSFFKFKVSWFFLCLSMLQARGD